MLAQDAAPPSRQLRCGGSPLSLALPSGAACVAAACSDRTVRVWSLAELAADRPQAPAPWTPSYWPGQLRGQFSAGASPAPFPVQANSVRPCARPSRP